MHAHATPQLGGRIFFKWAWVPLLDLTLVGLLATVMCSTRQGATGRQLHDVVAWIVRHSDEAN